MTNAKPGRNTSSGLDPLLALALKIHLEGRALEAGHLYRQILSLDPTHPGALHLLALLLLEGRDFSAAARLLARRVAVGPATAEVLIPLGDALAGADPGQGEGGARLANVLACYRNGAILDPGAAAAFTGMGNALRSAGRPGPALDCYDRVLRLAPGDCGAWINAGTALQDLGRTDEALGIYDRAIVMSPTGVETAHVDKAILLEELGRIEEAATAAREAVAANPRSAAAWDIRAKLKTFGSGDPDIAAMEEVLAATAPWGPGGADHVLLRFALGKACMDAGEPDRAFAHLLAGNRLHRAGLDYDADRRDRVVQATIEIFAPALIDRFRGSGNLSELPLFIVGMPRSGTTLVAQILASHPDVVSAGETMALPSAVGRLGRAKGLPFPWFGSGLTDGDLDGLAVDYLSAVTPLAGGGHRLVDKMMLNFDHVGLIRLALPRARIIHCLRDPLDTCLSCFSRRFTGRLDFTYDLGELGRFHRGYARLMRHWGTWPPAGPILDLRYEDLVVDPLTEIRRLLAFCGLDWSDACLDFHRHPGPVRTASAVEVRRPLYRTGLGRWIPYARHLGPLIAALGGDPMITEN